MKNDHDIFNTLRDDPSMRLTNDERALMRSALEDLSRPSAAELRVPTALPSPYFSFFMRPMPVAALALILIVATGSTAAAAGTALPGDTLYGVKVHLNEGVERAFAFSDEAKANVEIRHVEERLREVELLAAEGEEDRASDAAAKVEDRVLVAKERVKGKEAEAKLASALSAHADILVAQAGDDAGMFGHSVAALARIAADEDANIEHEDAALALAKAERIWDLIEKAHERLNDDDIDAEAKAALTEELAQVEDALVGAAELAAPKTLAELERSAYRVLALADAAERIRGRTGKDIFIRFNARGNADAPPPLARGKGMPGEEAATATLMMAVAEDADADSEDHSGSGKDEEERDEREDGHNKGRFERSLEFKVYDRDDD